MVVVFFYVSPLSMNLFFCDDLQPRWLVTVDADLRPLYVPLQMGEAAEIVFTPVVFRGDRALLATKK